MKVHLTYFTAIFVCQKPVAFTFVRSKINFGSSLNTKTEDSV